MVLEAFTKLNKNEIIEPGDIVCVDDNGLAKKVDNPGDLLKVIGVCSDTNNDEIQIGIAGKIAVKTNDLDIQVGDWLVAEIDGTARIRDSHDEDIDLLGMAITKPENGKVMIKIK